MQDLWKKLNGSALEDVEMSEVNANEISHEGNEQEESSSSHEEEQEESNERNGSDIEEDFPALVEKGQNMRTRVKVELLLTIT